MDIGEVVVEVGVCSRLGEKGGGEEGRGGGVRGQPLVPLCLFDKSNRWPLTVKSLPRMQAEPR